MNPESHCDLLVIFGRKTQIMLQEIETPQEFISQTSSAIKSDGMSRCADVLTPVSDPPMGSLAKLARARIYRQQPQTCFDCAALC
jgi:hypothetical protein